MTSENRSGPLPGEFAAAMRKILETQTLPSSTAKRHHFVPQLLLRQFVSDELRGERLWQLDVHTGESVPILVKEAASRPGLYRVDVEGDHHPAYLEGLFEKVESAAAAGLETLRTPEPALDEAQRMDVSWLLALQHDRGPGDLERLRKHATAAGTMMLEQYLEDPAARRAFGGRQTRPWDDALAAETLEQLRDGRLRITAPKEAALAALLSQWMDRACRLDAMYWKLLRTTEGQFVVSDRALVVHDPAPDRVWAGTGLMTSSNAYALMPLSPGVALRIDHRGPNELVTRSTARQPEVINKLSYGFADRHLYARSESVLRDLHAWATASPQAVHRPRPRPLAVFDRDPDGEVSLQEVRQVE